MLLFRNRFMMNLVARTYKLQTVFQAIKLQIEFDVVIIMAKAMHLYSKVIDKLFPKNIIVTVHDEPDAEVFVIRLCVNGRPTARMQCYIDSDSSILIGDIRHDREKRDYNKGYGSMLMQKLIDYARKNNYGYIHGNLSVVDFDHKDRLHHFYQKFGFTVTEFSIPRDCCYGKIELYV